jgi:hypothetical protein
LQFLAGLEAHSFAGRDADFLAGARIASNASLARADVEYAEAAQLDSLTLTKSALHGLEDGLDGLFRLGPGDAGLGYHRVHYVELNHTSLRFPQRQAMLDMQLRVVKLHALELSVAIAWSKHTKIRPLALQARNHFTCLNYGANTSAQPVVKQSLKENTLAVGERVRADFVALAITPSITAWR